MSRFLLSPAAQADLDAIWTFSVATWGEDQAERYILKIRDLCSALASGARKGRAIDEVRAGYWKISVGSHVLFYRHTAGGDIDVVRILHQRMDVPARLDDP